MSETNTALTLDPLEVADVWDNLKVVHRLADNLSAHLTNGAGPEFVSQVTKLYATVNHLYRLALAEEERRAERNRVARGVPA